MWAPLPLTGTFCCAPIVVVVAPWSTEQTTFSIGLEASVLAFAVTVRPFADQAVVPVCPVNVKLRSEG